MGLRDSCLDPFFFFFNFSSFAIESHILPLPGTTFSSELPVYKPFHRLCFQGAQAKSKNRSKKGAFGEQAEALGYIFK